MQIYGSCQSKVRIFRGDWPAMENLSFVFHVTLGNESMAEEVLGFSFSSSDYQQEGRSKDHTKYNSLETKRRWEIAEWTLIEGKNGEIPVFLEHQVFKNPPERGAFPAEEEKFAIPFQGYESAKAVRGDRMFLS